MNKVFAVLILIVVAISACSPTPTPLPVPSTPPIEVTALSSTQTSELTATQTLNPKPIPSTQTLDVSSLVTVTPAPSAKCPAADGSKRLSVGYILQNTESPPDGITNSILEFLNNGGSLKAAYDGLDKQTDDIKAFILDLTNDGVPELILQRSPYLFIFGCDNNHYKTIYQINNEDGEVYIYALQDYNLNGILEIIFRRNYPHIATLEQGYIHSVYSYYFLEWNGLDFQNILTTDVMNNDGLLINSNNPLGIPAVTIQGEIITTDAENQNSWEISDYDNNGLKDIRIVGGHSFLNQESRHPFRQAILTLSWNGKAYVPFQIMYKAVYRIDVARDADSAFLLGNYEQALSLYHEAIQNDKLLEWPSIQEARSGWRNRFVAKRRAQAYIYYRMMLTHVVQGNLDEALKDYNTLQSQFVNDDETVSSYATMAIQFYNDYQVTQNIASSCTQVINYAKANPIVLTSLFATFSELDYQPKDLCPIE
jgi:hypothetical protein